MGVWKLIWIVALIAGIAAFAYISFTVIIKGISEVRSLLKKTTDV